MHAWRALVLVSTAVLVGILAISAAICFARSALTFFRLAPQMQASPASVLLFFRVLKPHAAILHA